MSSLALKTVKHAVFDAYGTLFDVHSAMSRYQARLGEKAQAVTPSEWPVSHSSRAGGVGLAG